MIFSEKLQLIRKNKGLTQEELAEKFVLLDVPMIVDRSADEEKDDAKAEWSKVYEAIFAQTDSTDSSAKN